jgi:hypothetical protein
VLAESDFPIPPISHTVPETLGKCQKCDPLN